MIQYGKKIVNVVLVSDLNDGMACSWLQCEIKGNNLSVVDQSLTDDLKSISGKEVLVVMSSKSSLTLQSEKDSPMDALQDLLPGAVEEDYFIQKSTPKQVIYEFIHQSDLEEILAKIEGVKCTRVILESVALKSSFQAVNSGVLGVNYRIDEQGNLSLREEASSVDRYELDGKHLSSTELLGLGAVLANESRAYDEWNELEELELNRKSCKEVRNLKITGIAAVGVMFVLSLGNFFLFSQYSEKVREVNTILSSSNVSLSKLEELRGQASFQEELRSSLNTISSAHGAYLVDKICAEVPTQVSLANYSVEGASKIKSKKKIEFSDKVIVIRGNTISTIALNQWMQGIESFSEINSVKLISYEDSKEKKGDFEIGITLSDV